MCLYCGGSETMGRRPLGWTTCDVCGGEVPRRVRVSRDGDAVVLRFREGSWMTVLVAGVFVVWLVVALGWLLTPDRIKDVIGGVFLTLVAVLGLWASVTGLVNHVVIRIERGALLVRHDPLPPHVERRIDRAVIDQVYVQERRRKRHRIYVLLARLTNGNEIEIASVGGALPAARFLEERIETLLAIPDARLDGEHPPEAPNRAALLDR